MQLMGRAMVAGVALAMCAFGARAAQDSAACVDLDSQIRLIAALRDLDVSGCSDAMRSLSRESSLLCADTVYGPLATALCPVTCNACPDEETAWTRNPNQPPDMCCQADTVPCEACKAGLPQVTFCTQLLWQNLFPDAPESLHEQCSSMTTQFWSESAELKKQIDAAGDVDGDGDVDAIDLLDDRYGEEAMDALLEDMFDEEGSGIDSDPSAGREGSGANTVASTTSPQDTKGTTVAITVAATTTTAHWLKRRTSWARQHGDVLPIVILSVLFLLCLGACGTLCFARRKVRQQRIKQYGSLPQYHDAQDRSTTLTSAMLDHGGESTTDDVDQNSAYPAQDEGSVLLG